MNVANKTIIITGATSGIGYETAQIAVQNGANVLIHSSLHSEDKAKEICAKLGKQSAYFAFDLRKQDNIGSIIESAVSAFGRVDALVNNAGMFPRNNILNFTNDDYEDIMNVNIKSPMFLNQALSQYFIDNKIAGSIVNVGSINAYCGQDDIFVYSCSKGALMTMTRNMADYLGKYRIRVNQINVGWTHTEQEHQTQLREGRDENWASNIPSAFAPRGTILAPEEVAKHILFWVSDDSTPVSGSVYEVEQYPIIGRNKINAS